MRLCERSVKIGKNLHPLNLKLAKKYEQWNSMKYGGGGLNISEKYFLFQVTVVTEIFFPLKISIFIYIQIKDSFKHLDIPFKTV